MNLAKTALGSKFCGKNRQTRKRLWCDIFREYITACAVWVRVEDRGLMNQESSDKCHERYSDYR